MYVVVCDPEPLILSGPHIFSLVVGSSLGSLPLANTHTQISLLHSIGSPYQHSCYRSNLAVSLHSWISSTDDLTMNDQIPQYLRSG